MRLLTLIFLFSAACAFGQKRPDQQPTKAPEPTDAIYTQEGNGTIPAGVIRKIKFDKAREYFSALVNPACVAATPPGIDAASMYKGQYITVCSNNYIYYIDGTGRSKLIYVPSSAGYSAGTGININGLGVISNLGDTNPTDDITNTTSLNGDLTGTLPNPTVDGLQGRPVSGAAPASGQVLKWNGTSWAPAVDNNNTYTAGPGVTLTGNQFSASDVSNTNELQQLLLNGNDLSLSNGGGTVVLPSGGATYTAGTGVAISGSNVINNTAPDQTVTLTGGG
ncbi:MAG: hypothetical protein ACRC1V_04270, partial [Plesiomonas sp.]